MNNKKLLFSFSLFIVIMMSVPVLAQKKALTFQDLVAGGRFTLPSVRQLQWCGDTYVFAKGDSLFMALPTDKKERIGLTLKQLNEALISASLPEAGSMPGFFAPDKKKQELAFQYRDYRVHYDLTAGKVVAKYTYPGHTHGVGGKDRLHLYEMMTKYFVTNL